MRRFALIIACALLLCVGCGASISKDGPSPRPATNAQEQQSVVGFYLDTVITITAYGAQKSLLEEALAQCAKYEALLSKTVEGSDVWRINNAYGQPIVVDGHTSTILKAASYYSALSQGAFDITIAPAMSLWDFTSGAATLPDVAELQKAAELTDYTMLKLDGNSVTLPTGMMIDLGGIAKGYIADEIASFLKERNVKNAILNFGGNVVTIGTKPDGSAWSVGIQDPDGVAAYVGAVECADGSVVTSGTYERGFDLNGVRYHHILDPKTGWPVQNALASVTILSKRSMDADALSTACFVLGYERALPLLKAFGQAEAVFITEDGQIIATDGVKDTLTLPEKTT